MRLCFDACVLIYAVEGDARFGTAARSALGTALEPVTSVMSELECRVLPSRQEDAETLEKYDGLFARMRVVVTSPEIARRAAGLRAKIPGLRTPDAIHAATALSEGVPFVTADPGFRRVPGLDVRPFGT